MELEKMLIDSDERSEEALTPTKCIPPNDLALTSTVPDARKKVTAGHRILSRHPRQALVKAGENIRLLERIEKALRAELQPTGIIGQIIFDRLLSCLWRCLLAARKEKDVLESEIQHGNFEQRLEKAKESQLLALAAGNAKSLHYQSDDLLQQLSIIQRYDAHYYKEVCRAVGILLALRGAGDAELAVLLNKTLGHGRGEQ
jgi:hypothetical protein